MLELSTCIKLDADSINSPNLCARFEKSDLQAIGTFVYDGFERDNNSRLAWLRRTETAMDLALQIQKEKNFPWPNCSNIQFPLITIATMQFHARAYPSLLAGPNFVNCRVIGEDKSGEKLDTSKRVSAFMSYQVSEEDSDWEEQHDRLLINYAVVGSAFVKTYYSGRLGHNVSETVLAKDLVLNYWAKSLNDCDRKTHIIPLSRNEVYERVMRGTFSDIREEGWYTSIAVNNPSASNLKADTREGVAAPQADSTTTFKFLEQHCSLDLDGDGYAEPYIITIEESSRCVCRIVTRFTHERAIERVSIGKHKGAIITIKADEYFTAYTFIPSPDGGIYGIGFGVLCGPLNESANSLVNQLVDAGTMANGGGGFLGRGAKIRGGNYTFAPFEWKRVDSTGEDLHKSIVPLQVREPSNVLLSLLSLIIDYTNRITGSTDVRSGENPGQNTPASTTKSMIEEGGRIYSAIFKRAWRAMREEFKKLYALNGVYLPLSQTFGEQGYVIRREDFSKDSRAIVPAADPNIVSDESRVNQAMILKQAAMTTPGYNREAVEKRFLEAIRVDGIEQIYPGPDKVAPLPNPKVQVEEMKLKDKAAAREQELKQFAAELQEERKKNDAEIVKLHAQAAKLMEEAGGVQTGHAIAAFEAMIGARKQHDDSMAKQIELLMKDTENGAKNPNAGGVPRVADSSSDASSQPASSDVSGGLS